MTTERDELENIIAERYHATRPTPTVLDSAIAGAILAAGYRKPQQVTTVEELDALPGGVVIRSAAGVVYVKEYEMFEPETWWWVTAGAVGEFPTSRIARPATVLHVGGAE